jgi:hypothetical protein
MRYPIRKGAIAFKMQHGVHYSFETHLIVVVAATPLGVTGMC